MKKIFFAFFLILLFFYLTPSFIQTSVLGADSSAVQRTGCPSEGLVPCGNSTCPCKLCDFFLMFDRIIKFLLLPPFGLVPIIATLMILIGGFMYIIAYGGPAEILEGGKKGGAQLISQAKSLFKSVIIGLFIIYGAWLVIDLFFMVIGVASWTGLKGGWQIINCN